jgi:hypothetical protein
MVTAGTCTIAGDQSGNSNWTAAPQQTQNITIAQAPQTGFTVTATPNSIYVNGSSQLSSTGDVGGGVSYSVASGPCSIYYGSTVVGLGVGICTVTAISAANSKYESASSTVTVNVSLSPQAALTLTPSATSVRSGQSVTLSTTGGSGDGTVTYTASPQVSPSSQQTNRNSVTVSSALVCGISGNILTPTGGSGICVVTATKAADGPYAEATAQSNITVTAAPPPANPIPTLSEWAQILMMLMMTGSVGWYSRKMTR